jgi:hypothetical protein
MEVVAEVVVEDAAEKSWQLRPFGNWAALVSWERPWKV